MPTAGVFRPLSRGIPAPAVRPLSFRASNPRFQFPQFAWGVLLYTFFVVLGGAFVRATISGDGCGDHWPDCNGRLIPHPGRIETVIEFCHRVSSGLLLPLTIILL